MKLAKLEEGARKAAATGVMVLASVFACAAEDGASAPAETAAATASPAASNPAVTPNILDGRPIMQLGLDGWTENTVMVPFLNLARLALAHDDGPWSADCGGGRRVFADLWNAGFIDRATFLPTAIPEGCTRLRGAAFRFGARHYPVYFAGAYVAEWEGDADLRFGYGHRDQKKTGANRIEATYPRSDAGPADIEITRLGPGGLKSITVYRKQYEARVRAGEVWDPDYLAHVRRYKVLRMLDVQAPGVASARSVDDLTPMTAAHWGMGAALDPRAPTIPTGKPLRALADLAVAADAALWMHVAGLIGAPEAFDSYSLKGGAGDMAAFKPAARREARRIIESVQWDRYAAALVAALEAAGYPETRLLYVEVGNETWNTAHPFWWLQNYYGGVGQGFGVTEAQGLDHAFGQGIAAARFAIAFDKALKDAGRRQAWVSVLGSQMAWDEVSRSVLNGFRFYLDEKRLDKAPYLARAGLSTASYYGDGLEPWGLFKAFPGARVGQQPRSAAEEAAWVAAWRAAVKNKPQETGKALADWLVSSGEFGSIPWMIARRKEHRARAVAAGAFFLGDYEGESHLAGGVASPARLGADPLFVNWFENWEAGPDGERVTRAWADALVADDPQAIIANYKSIGPFDPEGDDPNDRVLDAPWVDGFYGEDNGRTRALDRFLRPAHE